MLLHTRRSSTQSDISQVSHWYSYFSWWWVHGCPKHVENRSKHTKKLCVNLVIYMVCRKVISIYSKVIRIHTCSVKQLPSFIALLQLHIRLPLSFNTVNTKAKSVIHTSSSGGAYGTKGSSLWRHWSNSFLQGWVYNSLIYTLLQIKSPFTYICDYGYILSTESILCSLYS